MILQALLLVSFESPSVVLAMSRRNTDLASTAVTQIDSQLFQPLIALDECFVKELDISDEWQLVFEKIRLFFENPPHGSFLIYADWPFRTGELAQQFSIAFSGLVWHS